MTAQGFALVAAVAFLGFAVVAGRERWLLAAVGVYTAVASWIIQTEMSLVMPALAMAIGLGVLGLGTVLYREATALDEPGVRDRRKVRISNAVQMQNIGSSSY